MSSFTIIGAGHSGLLLGIGLRQRGHDVTIVTDRKPDEVRTGHVMSTNGIFGAACAVEAELGVDFWADVCPEIQGFQVTVAGPDGTPALQWRAPINNRGQAVDQRIKFPRFMEHFEEQGGRLIFHRADAEDLEAYADKSDLVVVATGKSAISHLFARNPERSPYDQAQRQIVMMCARGVESIGGRHLISFNAVPGQGEMFIIPGYNDGPFHHLYFGAIADTPLDEVWRGVKTPDEYLSTARKVLETWTPWELSRCRAMSMTDERGYLRGSVTPTVRDPVAHLRSGACVLGLGDALVLNDPLLGQGANNAVKSAAIYLRCIDACEDGNFDEAWMRATFDQAWEYSQWPTRWTNAMLEVPMPGPLQQLVAIAGENPEVAETFVNCFDRPELIVPMLFDPVKLASLGVDVSAS